MKKGNQTQKFQFLTSPLWTKVLSLTNNVADDQFRSNVYDLLSEAAEIAHYSVIIYDLQRLDEPTLAMVFGDISEYWARIATRRTGKYARKCDVFYDKTLLQLAKGILQPGGLFRFQPDPLTQPDHARIFEESSILEKIYDLRIRRGKIYQLNMYRAIGLGPFSDTELCNVETVIPLIMNLLMVHFQICGTDEWQKHNKRRLITSLRDKGVPSFESLTKQETRVCDLIIYGLTTDGIAAQMNIGVSSVKTYRNRAYRKLAIASKSEMFAMIIHYLVDSDDRSDILYY